MLRILLCAICCWAGSYAAVTSTFDVTTVIQSRFAETTIESIVINNKPVDDEINFQSILPKEAYITSFSMKIDDKWYDGTIEEKEEAERVFEKLKAKNKTTGIVRTKDESIKTFKTSVNVGPRKEVEFKLVYQQLLRRHQGKYTNRLILLGKQFSEKLRLNVYICESSEITNVTVPPAISSNGTKVSPEVNIDHQGNFAHIEFLPENSDDPVVRALSKTGGSFTVEYSTAVSGAGDIVIDDKYFMHFFDPNAADAPDAAVPKRSSRRMMFVLDTSGSMTGSKLQQMKDAMTGIIDGFTEEDRFGVMQFNNRGMSWTFNGQLVTKATKRAIAHAQRYINSLSAGGGTNILDTLVSAMSIMNEDIGEDVMSVDPSTNYIIFLTDGQGNGPPLRVLDAMKRDNTKRVAIHSIGLGTNVNFEFLKMLAAQNYGTWRQILADTSAVLQIQGYLMEIGFATVDGGLSITYPPIVKEKIMIGKDRMPVGGEMVTIGRFKNPSRFSSGSHVITVEQTKKEDLNLTFTITQVSRTCSAAPFARVKGYGKKAYGIMQVEEILRQMDAEMNFDKKELLKQEAIELSIRYKLVTPVTAMLVVKPEDLAALEAEEKANEAERLRKEQEAKDKLKEKDGDADKDVDEDATSKPPVEVTTAAAETATPNATVPWWSTNGDPHFIVHLSNNITSCFNWFGEDGDIYNLLTDTKNEVVINGQLKNSNPDSHSLFIQTIAILSLKHNVAVMVEPRSVLVRDFTVLDKRMRDLQIPVINTHGFETTIGRINIKVLSVNKAHTILNVTIDNSVSFVINLHHFEEYSADHLDFVIPHTNGFDDNLSGIFGSFPKEARHGAPLEASLDALGQKHLLWFHNRLIPVEQRSMEIPTINRRVQCWFVSNAGDILGHDPSYFQVNRIYDVPSYEHISAL